MIGIQVSLDGTDDGPFSDQSVRSGGSVDDRGIVPPIGQKRDIMETVDKFKSQKIRVLLIMTLQSQSNDVAPPFHRPLLQGEI